MKDAVFVGAWRLERRIKDVAAGRWARFSGKAEIAHGDDAAWPLAYLERGRLTMSTGGFDAERRQLWRLRAGALEIAHGAGARAEDEVGALIVSLPLGAPRALAEHLCGEDRYAARLRIHHPIAARDMNTGAEARGGALARFPLSRFELSRFELSWRVVGPRKDYVMSTRFRRA